MNAQDVKVVLNEFVHHPNMAVRTAWAFCNREGIIAKMPEQLVRIHESIAQKLVEAGHWVIAERSGYVTYPSGGGGWSGHFCVVNSDNWIYRTSDGDGSMFYADIALSPESLHETWERVQHESEKFSAQQWEAGFVQVWTHRVFPDGFLSLKIYEGPDSSWETSVYAGQEFGFVNATLCTLPDPTWIRREKLLQRLDIAVAAYFNQYNNSQLEELFERTKSPIIQVLLKFAPEPNKSWFCGWETWKISSVTKVAKAVLADESEQVLFDALRQFGIE